jgi:hypothetical protein
MNLPPVLTSLLFAPGPEPVYPTQGNGFAATIVTALLALALLVLVMRWISSPSKRRRKR